jgi:outer membrane protein TolC
MLNLNVMSKKENNKMRFIIVYLFTIIIFALAPVLQAQEQQNITLSLQGSIDYALEYNPQYQMSEKELKKAKADVLGSYAGILPTLEAYGNYQRAWIIQESTIPNFIKEMLGEDFPGYSEMPDYVDISFGLKNTFIYGARINQPIFQGGAGIYGIKAAKAAKKATEEEVESSRQNLIFQTVNAYYSCLLTEEMVAVQEEALTQAKANLAVVETKYNVGAASGFDKMRAEVDVENLKPAVITAKNNYQYALTSLKFVLGLEKETRIELTGELVYVPESLDTLTLLELQEMAYDMRPELQATEHQKYAARMGINIAFSNFLPKVYFSSDYSYLSMTNEMRLAQNDFNEGHVSTISLQLPLFQGFRSTQRYQKAKLDHKILLDMEKQLRDVIAAEVEVTYNKFNEAKEKFLSASQTIELARESLRLANLMYEEGSNTQVDVLSARLALTQAQMNYVSSLYEYQVSRYRMRKAVGVLKGVIDV